MVGKVGRGLYINVMGQITKEIPTDREWHLLAGERPTAGGENGWECEKNDERVGGE
jgi:hypothetical protein